MPKKPASKARKPAKAVAKKPPRTVVNDENCLHMHAWAWTAKTHPGLLIFHVANERQAAVQYHVKLKRLGVMKGVADFLAFPMSGRKIAIELKDDEGEQDTDQIRFQKRWELAGGVYYVVRTLTEFQSIVTALVLFG